MIGKTVLVTGSNGFTGYYLCQELRKHGFNVIGYGTSSINSSSYVRGDLLEPSSILAALETTKPDYIVHLAAISFVGHGNPNDFYDVNTIGTRNLLSALVSSSLPIKKILVASSANVYGQQNGGYIDETSPFSPSNDYSVSKVAMEYICKIWADRLPIIITRPFNYTGVGQSNNFLIPKIVHHFRNLEPVIELGNINIRRDFSDVRSLCEAYVGLLEEGRSGQIYNVCSGISRSLQSIIQECEFFTNHKIDIHVNQNFIRENEIDELAGDCSKLCSILPGWSPRPFSETLSWMLDIPLT